MKHFSPPAILSLLFVICAALPQTHGDTVKWKGQSGEYTSGSNWINGDLPNTANGDTALIEKGDVTYTPGGDLTLANGGKLQLSGGSWKQVTDPAYIRLSGKGSIVIDGGSFDQGSSSSTPFAVEGTENHFIISNGSANFSSSFNVNPGLTYTQTGGTVTVAGEFDFNTNTVFMSGGTLNTTLLTGVNAQGPDPAIFNFSGGTINLSSDSGIYGGGPTQFVNFTPDSTGIINFNNAAVTEATIETWLANSVIQVDQKAAKLSDFKISKITTGGFSLKLAHPKSKPAENPKP